MGWPTKGTGKNYNSHTGFGHFMGAYTQKVLMSKIFCRRCRFCLSVQRKDVQVKAHNCVQNYPTDESSKGMEAAAILDMSINCITERKFVMRTIVSDDDSVMRAHVRHKISDAKSDKGKLPPWIHQPDFMADPSHRIKTIAKHFYKLALQRIAESRVSKPMAKRLKKKLGLYGSSK